jgi:hypothetical protein
VYVGDAVPISTSQKALADQLAASAVATALAIVLAGVAAYSGLWRLGFVAPVLASFSLGIFFARLPAPEKEGDHPGPLANFGGVFRRPWAVLVVLLALVEGGVILGFLTHLPRALEAGVTTLPPPGWQSGSTASLRSAGPGCSSVWPTVSSREP